MKKTRILSMVMCVLCLVGLFSGCNKGESKIEETTIVSEETTTKIEVITEENTTEKESKNEITTEEKKTEEKKTEKEERTTKIPSTTKKETVTNDNKNYTETVTKDGWTDKIVYKNGKKTVVYTYDDKGTLYSTTTYEYYANGKLKKEYRDTVSSADTITEYNDKGQELRWTYIRSDGKKGQINEYIDGKKAKVYSYDSDGIGYGVAYYDIKTGNETDFFRYNKYGVMIQHNEYRADGTLNARYDFDDYGNPKYIRYYDLSGKNIIYVEKF